MKKIAVIAIVVLLLPVGFGYSASSTQPNMAGPLTTLSLDVTYEEETGYESKTLSEGKKWVTVVPGIERKVIGKFKYEPVLYFYFDTSGNLTHIIISWLNPPGTSYPEPDPGFSGTRIVPISCGSGNVFAPTPDLPAEEDGIISTKPQHAIGVTPATITGSFRTVANCWFCPDGFAFNSTTGVPTGVCNGGESYVAGIMTLTGTATKNTTTKEITSFSVNGTMASSGFYYLGETDWASPNCTTYPDFLNCKGYFTGSFAATLAPCSTTDPNCYTVE